MSRIDDGSEQAAPQVAPRSIAVSDALVVQTVVQIPALAYRPAMYGIFLPCRTRLFQGLLTTLLELVHPLVSLETGCSTYSVFHAQETFAGVTPLAVPGSGELQSASITMLTNNRTRDASVTSKFLRTGPFQPFSSSETSLILI